MNINLDDAMNWIFKAEGHLVDDPNDPGGITNYGISLRALIKMGEAIGDIDGDGDIDADDIRAMTKEKAEVIYEKNYWDPCRCDNLPSGLDLAVFDSAVNCGVKTTGRLLQEVLHILDDGIIGPATLTAVMKTQNVIPLFLSRRAKYYHDVATGHPKLEKFVAGWLNRTFLLYQYIKD